MKREFPNHPILCVGGIIIQDGSVLLVRRGNPPLKGEWTLPGGMVELGEKVQSAVRREIREETGLRVEPTRLAAIYERIVRLGGRVKYHYTVLDYVCQVKGGHLKAGSDVAGARWVAYEELKRYRLRRPAIEAIHGAIKPG
ncbi:MAG TPA: NUDIX hydrolase [Terriglobia bacterium]|nr:NUDIX hydrolase [Terriglobia bacterium]